MDNTRRTSGGGTGVTGGAGGAGGDRDSRAASVDSRRVSGTGSIAGNEDAAAGQTSGRRASGGATNASALPMPEVDIMKTPYFMTVAYSGGPHMDALLHNQASIMKLLQDIRIVQSRGIPLDSEAAAKSAARVTYGEAVKAIMNNKANVDTLTGYANNWITVGNKMAKIRSNKSLAANANALFTVFKDQLADEWELELDEIADDDTKELVKCLKAIDDSQALKEDLHIALAKYTSAVSVETEKTSEQLEASEEGTATPARATRGGKQEKRGRGSRGGGTKTRAAARGGSRGTTATASGSRNPETGEPSRKRTRRSDHSEEDSDDDDDDDASFMG